MVWLVAHSYGCLASVVAAADRPERVAGLLLVAPPEPDRFLDAEQLGSLTAWWRQALDRIPCMLAPSGARHLGLQDRAAVEAFVLGALHEPPPGPACR